MYNINRFDIYEVIMAFIVEDGTNVANANAYTDTEFADAYFADRGITSWASLTTEQKQQRIVVATQYIDTRWLGQFKGNQFYETQSLQFPRDFWTRNVVDPEHPDEPPTVVPIMPIPLLQACCEYSIAVDAETMSLAGNFETSETGLAIKRKKEQVGTLQTDTEYFSSGTELGSVWATYTIADGIMASLLKQNIVWRCYRA